jgi:hypothetical protein
MPSAATTKMVMTETGHIGWCPLAQTRMMTARTPVDGSGAQHGKALAVRQRDDAARAARRRELRREKPDPRSAIDRLDPDYDGVITLVIPVVDPPRRHRFRGARIREHAVDLEQQLLRGEVVAAQERLIAGPEARV